MIYFQRISNIYYLNFNLILILAIYIMWSPNSKLCWSKALRHAGMEKAFGTRSDGKLGKE
jgi:hypothetical protein